MGNVICPFAIQEPLGDIGDYDKSYAPRIVAHTTEGSHYPGTSLYHGTHPTFTCDFKRRKTYQHTKLDKGAMALKNLSGGVETNRANCVQIELVGFAAESGIWSDADYAYIRKLFSWIRLNHHVNPHVANPWTQHRFTEHHWRTFNGLCGHMHVPENDHVDPGNNFKGHLALG